MSENIDWPVASAGDLGGRPSLGLLLQIPGAGDLQWLPLHLSSGHCTYVGTFSKIVPIRPDVGLLFEMSRHGQVVVVRTIYSSS